MNILHIVGARPNFMKVAPVYRALARRIGVNQSLIHTGQHYDANMSDVFFRELEIPTPDVNLNVGSGSHAQQTAQIMSRFEPVVLQRKPYIVLVYGDVNSTVAAALVCSKLVIKVGHVEAGLRSFDLSMPEEINRLITDRLSDLLFTPSQDANENLLREGIALDKICLVGNVMIDTLVRMLPMARERMLMSAPDRYALVTLHRPSNVDDSLWLSAMLRTLREVSKQLPVLFPIHPRTRNRLLSDGLDVTTNNGLRFLDPLPYLEFLALQASATLVITDSGGVQEETTYLGTPCLTVRENTERPITVSTGTNVLVGRDLRRLKAAIESVLSRNFKSGLVPQLWDGCAAERIADRIMNQ